MHRFMKYGALTAIGALLAAPAMAQGWHPAEHWHAQATPVAFNEQGGQNYGTNYNEGAFGNQNQAYNQNNKQGWMGGENYGNAQNRFANPSQYRPFTSNEGQWNRSHGYSGEHYGQRYSGSQQGYPQQYGSEWNHNWQGNQGNWQGNRNNRFGQNQNWNANQGNNEYGQNWSGNQGRIAHHGWRNSQNRPYTAQGRMGWGSEVGYSGQTGFSNNYVPNGYRSNMPETSQNGRFTQNTGNQPYNAQQFNRGRMENHGQNNAQNNAMTGQGEMANHGWRSSANAPYTTPGNASWGTKVGYSGPTGFTNSYVPNGYQSNMPDTSQNGRFSTNAANEPFNAHRQQGRNFDRGSNFAANQSAYGNEQNYESGRGAQAGLQNYTQGSNSGNGFTNMTGNSE